MRDQPSIPLKRIKTRFMGKFHPLARSESVSQIEARFSNNLDFHGQLFGNSGDSISLAQLEDFMRCWAATAENESEFREIVLDCFKLRDYLGVYGGNEFAQAETSGYNNKRSHNQNDLYSNNRVNYDKNKESNYINQRQELGLGQQNRRSSNIDRGFAGVPKNVRQDNSSSIFESQVSRQRKRSFYDEFKQAQPKSRQNQNKFSENYPQSSQSNVNRENKWGGSNNRLQSQNLQNDQQEQWGNQQNRRNRQSEMNDRSRRLSNMSGNDRRSGFGYIPRHKRSRSPIRNTNRSRR